jgi:hypothetical protein
MPKRLVKAILDYVKHIDDASYFDRLLERWSPTEIAHAVAELTSSDDHQVVSLATLFAQDGRRLLAYVDFHARLTEASFRLRELEVQDEGRAVGPGTRRRLPWAVQADAPPLTFLSIRLSFENYLWSKQRGDYDLNLLDAWVRYREQCPPPTAEHHDRSATVADYRRFTAAYRARSNGGAPEPA